MHFFHAVIDIVGAIESGGEQSPLSVESPFAEIIRLIQVGIFAGILWLLKEVKGNKANSTEAHNGLSEGLSDLRIEVARMRTERKKEIQILREEVQGITTRKQEQADQT